MEGREESEQSTGGARAMEDAEKKKPNFESRIDILTTTWGRVEFFKTPLLPPSSPRAAFAAHVR